MNLSSLLIWFYCLDYHELYLLMVLGTLAYLLQDKFLPPRGSRWINALLLTCWLVGILATTLFTRNETARDPLLIPFHSYMEAIQTGNVEIYRSNLMNALLFYPYGLLLGTAVCKKNRTLLPGMLFAILLSIEIEWCQFYFRLGNAEIDDVLHNTIGMMIGVAIPCLALKLKTICSGRIFYGSDC